MNLFSIGGFFGAGKTTLLLLLVRYLVGQGQQVAIVQNEIGKTGIDDLRLKLEGLNTSELLGGCVCCELRNSLVSTLRRIARDIAPDTILLEASGMATPDALAELFADSELEFALLRKIVVLDARRLDRLDDVLRMPYVENAVRRADLVLFNKCDLVAAHRVDDFRARALKLNPALRVCGTVLRDATELPDETVEALLHTPGAKTQRIADSDAAGSAHSHGRRPAVCALQCAVDSSAPFDPALFGRVLQELAAGCQRARAEMIGHLKLLAEFDMAPPVTVRLTSFDGAVHFEPADPIPAPLRRWTLNAIVFGLSDAVLTTLAQQSIPPDLNQ